MSRSKNARRGTRQKLPPFLAAERQEMRDLNIARIGAPHVGDARRLQAVHAHLADTIDAPDGGHFCSSGCCGMVDDRGWEVDMADGITTFTCKACEQRIQEDNGSAWVASTGAPHDGFFCTEQAWTRYHAETP